MRRCCIEQPRPGGHTGPRPLGSATSRKRPRPRESVSSGCWHRAQRRGGRLVGAKGTATSVARHAVPREFSAARYFLSLAAAVLGAGVLALELLELLLLDELPLLEPSFLVEL